MSIEWDPLNVRDLEDLSTLSEGVQQKLGEPHITEHKTFKPEDPSYAPFVKAPFIRPPPSTYLDESLLSMRKRRSTNEVAPRKNVYWSNKKKEPVPEKEQQKNTVSPEQKIRSRCDKCLSSFSSLEELQKHQALNTCSALFGFDSDDEKNIDSFTRLRRKNGAEMMEQLRVMSADEFVSSTGLDMACKGSVFGSAKLSSPRALL
ncbi:hypothetical protein GBF38_017311 [Nibea albiflora]|uniref:Uncharacterized protein n=1 Tax=Nibea albiflora TaxID=240163 RepID=A0ACB7EF84_NIBAL|nr:hypothetical protein GBF38_017311 [Nibea albiflora]